MVEAAVCMVIVGLMMVAALNTAGASRLSLRKMGDQGRGKLLAQALMSEILRQEYKDPDGSSRFGFEIGESATTRADFDDVDDYRNWTASPPQYKDGTEIPQTDGWQRTVTLMRVNSTNFGTSSALDLGLVKITVDVTYNGAPVASLTALRFGESSSIGGGDILTL
jgi:hypothetical protein